MSKKYNPDIESVRKMIEDKTHIPEFLKDPDNQIKIFTLIHQFVNDSLIVDPKATQWLHGITLTNSISFVMGFFLNVMACHGYALQKINQKIRFYDMMDSIEQISRNPFSEIMSDIEANAKKKKTRKKRARS